MKNLNTWRSLLLLCCFPFLVNASPIVNINPNNTTATKTISKQKLEKEITKKIGFGAKLKMRLLTKIVEKKLKKAIKKQAKLRQNTWAVPFALPPTDSLSYTQIINVKTKDLIKVLGLKPDVKTRAFLNRTKYEFKQNRSDNPALSNEKIAKTDLINWIQEAPLSSAEIAQYSGFGAAFSILGFILLQPEGLLLAALILAGISIIAYFIALFRNENAGCLGAFLSLFAVGGIMLVIIIAISRSQ